ncbi:MAG: 1-acyl-sn-glycerol-3-phosphate acyltransferase [archaeon]
MKEFKSIDDYFPYVEHSLNTICKSVLMFADFYSSRMFSSVDVEGLDNLKDFKKGNPDSRFIYVSRHRSHLDYFETQLALGKAGMPTRIQAGDNLFIGPFDPLLREVGAFMAIRGEKGFYSKKWLLNLIYSALPKEVGPYRKEYEVYIDKKKSKEIYEGYLARILGVDEASNDLLIYPEYVKQPDGLTKYGRSYSGSLADFSPYLFINLRRIISKLDKPFFFVAVNPSYERVIEDSFMTQIPRLKEKHSKDWVYMQEFAYISTRPLFPFFKPGRLVLKFGSPVEIEKGGNIKANAVNDVKMLGRDVGLLETPFSPQVLFHSVGGEDKVSVSDLESRVVSTISKLESSGVDVSYLKDRMVAALLYETCDLFDAPGRRFVRVKDGNLHILDKSIVSQYANHIAHLF